jgi:ubiquinone/menaquinone biosynthesis C-methylase UbiE
MTVQKDPEGNEARYLRKYADLAGKRVLEIGCGDGRLTWRYALAARRVTGIDLDRDELRIASIERASDLEKTVSLAQADSIHLPFRDQAFDLTILAWTF